MIDYDKYKRILYDITPRHVGAAFPINDCPVPLVGESVGKHLDGCKYVLVSCATLGEEFDRLLRQAQLTDISGAIILDRLAGEYIENFCDEKDGEIIIRRETSGKGVSGEVTGNRRFSPGYGDFPLSVSRDILNALNAQNKIGLCVTDNFILTPQKSITGVTGIK
ncbi:MAG: hypothetical protein LBI38_00660 [Oscillospiraceae bacterium]|jgi:hypothetical protein|nr:hypothetical protein [Oscillospiraceae bacterium]